MADRRNNKLEVKLQLMKGKELEGLRSFATRFEKSVTDLSTAMSDYTKRIEEIVKSGSAASGGGAPGSMAGSVTGGFAHAGYAAHAAREYSQSRARGAGTFAGAADGASAPSGGGGAGAAGPPAARGKDGSLNDEVILSQLMSNPMRAFQWQLPAQTAVGSLMSRLPGPRLDESGNPATRMGRAWETVRDNPGMVVAGAGTMGAAYMGSNFAADGHRGYALQAGMDTGADSGWAALIPGFLPSAPGGSKQAFKAKWSDRWAALSPAWSGDQAKELRQTMASMGMTRDPDNMMKDMMKQGHSGATVKAFADAARRYRPDQLPTVEADLDRLAASASAAGMSVEEFGAQAAQVSAALTRSLGISSRNAGDIAVVGAGYGLTPEQSAGMMSRESVFRSMALGTAGGGTVGQRYYGAANKLKPNVDSTKMLAKSILPGIENYKKLSAAAAKGDKSAMDKVGHIQMIASSAGVSELLGGLTPDELGNLYDPGKESKVNQRDQYSTMVKIDRKGLLKSEGRMREMLAADGGFGKKDKNVLKAIMDTKDLDKREKKLNDRILGQGGVKDQHVKLDLTPEAKRLVKQMGGKEDNSPEDAGTNWSRVAVEGATTLLPGPRELGLAIHDAIEG